MREKFLQSLKIKIFIILLIPAIGLFYFSSSYLYHNYLQYQKTRYLNDAVEYVKKTLALIHALQQERGLGAAYLSDEHFLNSYKKQQQKSRSLQESYNTFISLHSFKTIDFKKILKELEKLDHIREQVQRKRLTLLEELKNYSKIIATLIDSTVILESDFIMGESDFYKYIRTFNLVLKVAEFNGQERALISYLLSQKSIVIEALKYLIFVDIKEKATRELLDKEIPYKLLIEYQKVLSKQQRREFLSLKEKIIYSKNFSLISKEEWWQKATLFIDRLFDLEYKILAKLQNLQLQLKHQAIQAFVMSLLLWFLALLALGLFLKIFNKLLKDIVNYLQRIDIERRFYKTISEFGENALFVENENTLVSDFALLLYKIDFFEFVYMIECQSEEVVISENISLALIEGEMPSKIDQAIQKAKDGSYQIVYCTEFPQSSAFGIFPIHFQKECRYIVVAAMKKEYHLDEKMVDLIYKMVEIFIFTLNKLFLEREEKRLKDELKLLSYTFNSHEAITITDAQGKILKVNRAFEKITGYKQEEVLGKTPAILKSGKHDKEFYQQMWDEIRSRGFWKGEIYNKRKDGTIYPEILAITAIKNEKGEITNYIAHFFDISELKKAQEEVAYRAKFDILTNLINRQTLLEEMAVVRRSALKRDYFCAFFFIDVDNFKYANDTFGHAVGDKVLIEVAKILKSLAKKSDIAARIAGDEFGYVLVDAGESIEEAIKSSAIVAQKMLDFVSKPLKIEDIEVYIGFSIGIFIFPTTEKSVDEIVLYADLAMYHSKKSGKNSFTFFNEELDIASKQFLLKKRELEEGLREERFLLHYQPKVSLLDGSIEGFEALLRLDFKNSLLYPDKFLPYAKGNKIFQDLTEFVFKEVLKTLDEWEEFKGYISVNLAVELFQNSFFMERMYSWFDHPKASQIRIELLEDSFIGDVDYAKEHLKRLRSYGVECAVDDFGTGYSSLHLLRELPIKEVKIDKSFMIDFFTSSNAQMVAKMVEIAKLFDYEVCAEGVESTKVLQQLKEFECDTFQGFLFSRPLPKDEARKFI